MGSATKVASLTKMLLSKTALKLPPQRPYSAAPDLKLKSTLCKNKEINAVDSSMSINRNAEQIPVLGRAVRSAEWIRTTSAVAAEEQPQKKEKSVKGTPTPSSTGPIIQVQKLTGLLSSGRTIPWHKLISLSFQQGRFKSDTCTPKKTKFNEGPLPCTLEAKRPDPCMIPRQKTWKHPELTMCLPCCDKIDTPLSCKSLFVELNQSPRVTYRIPSYSECNKRYSKPPHKKECCYFQRVCYAKNFAEREITPLIPIKHRQARILGFGKVTPAEPWGQGNENVPLSI